jgi:hypothetical protein
MLYSRRRPKLELRTWSQHGGLKGEMSQLLLFPATRRVGTIRRWASNIATYNKVKSREKIIRCRLDVFAEGLRKVGFEESMVIQETASLETALRVEISRLLQYAPGRSVS